MRPIPEQFGQEHEPLLSMGYVLVGGLHDGLEGDVRFWRSVGAPEVRVMPDGLIYVRRQDPGDDGVWRYDLERS